MTRTCGVGGASDQPQKAHRQANSPAEKPMALRIHTRCSPHSVSSTLLVLKTLDSDVRILAICVSSRACSVVHRFDTFCKCILVGTAFVCRRKAPAVSSVTDFWPQMKSAASQLQERPLAKASWHLDPSLLSAVAALLPPGGLAAGCP